MILNEGPAVMISRLPPAVVRTNQSPDCRQRRAKFLRHRPKIDQLASGSKVDDEMGSEQKLCVRGYL